jgi:type II secretory pathway pseudopilin PulG
MKIFKNSSGFTLLETLISALITGIVVASAFQFYVSMHNQTMAQEEISEMQQNARACIVDITKNLRMAGFKIGTHDAFLINGDSLYVFYNDTQPVDTILYFLSVHPDKDLMGQYAEGSEDGEGAETPYRLMKKVNSDKATIFSDFVLDINFTQVNASTVVISVTTQVTKPDEDYVDNYGFRTYQSNESVVLRNI